MTKQEWLEYFQAVNDRIPTAEEYQAAQASGEFVEEAAPAAAPQQQAYNPVAQPAPNYAQPQPVMQQPAIAFQLMEGEEILLQDTFTASAIFRWMTTSVVVTNKRFVSRGHRFLGIIPVGSFELSYFQGSLASLDIERGMVDPLGFLIGVVVAFYSLVLFMMGAIAPIMILAGILLLVIGVVMAIASFHGVIWARNYGGATSGATCSLGEFNRLKKFYNDALPLIISESQKAE